MVSNSLTEQTRQAPYATSNWGLGVFLIHFIRQLLVSPVIDRDSKAQPRYLLWLRCLILKL